MQTESVRSSGSSEPGRGCLRVYLGAAPGVGKTYAMLDEGARRAARGTDVVVGVVETHGRLRTAEQLGDLEVVPRRSVEHGRTTLTELDVDAVLARAPQVCLVDELAHTNAPGSRNTKRWQDVEELLEAGIDVVTTVNVQHLESLNDVTEAITGVRQRETVPDSFVRAAEAIELVDMSPSALRRRLAHGNVYPADRVDAALSQFFREGNLAALRELALLWLAERVDEGLERYRERHEIDATWATRERIVVGVTGGPESESLLRRAARIASRGTAAEGGAPWSALYVSRGDGLRQTGPARLEELRRTVQDLGGSFHTAVGDDAATAILDFARGRNATQVLIGASRRGRLSTLLRPGIGETIVTESGDIDVHIVTHDEARRREARVREQSALGHRRTLAGFVVGVLGPFALAALLLATPELHGLPTEAMLFMVLVVGTALLGGLRPAVAASLVSGGVLNYFFTPPVRTLRIATGENAVAVVLFVLVGISVALVVDRAARLALLARRAREEAATLSVLAHQLVHAGQDLDRLLRTTVELVDVDGVVLRSVDGTVLGRHGELVGTETVVPVGTDHELVLVGDGAPGGDDALLAAVVAHVTVLLERRAASAVKAEQRVLAEGERTRTALLAAVSHDLRTPLAAVKAAVSSLRDPGVPWSDQDRADLLETIEDGADRLDALVVDLLDMSRLQTGAVVARTDPVDVGAVVQRVVTGAGVEVEVPDDLPEARADAALLERVLANIVENALKHADGATVRVDATAVGGRVVVRVVDRGPGVPEQRRDEMFAPFQRLGDVPRGSGVGLGLAVARGLTEAMAGTLTAEDTPGGGLTLVVELPRAAS
ncbi:ATP-binding protein [Aeromicrobium sp. Leaf245]|uniref:ATP-binding protein n=1 Tax=Aeromicrobium sp. Leaf245 TaxID=1736306 RepID=UPI0006FF5A85|nr:ATP-binding protein [Aeromicrobium sp. Leaf245]KQO39896.1 histidine kinase [Aeromicrobium sp. Leaf245]